MIATQLEFVPAPEPDANRALIEAILDERREWLSAAELQALVDGRLTDRQIRGLASKSDLIISGQNGYRHIRHATAEEIHHASAWLQSQARAMWERATRIERTAHKLIHANPGK